jgi:ubiquinone biosynthesis protein
LNDLANLMQNAINYEYKAMEKHRFRILKAYRTSLHVLLSYGWILLMSYIFGKGWQNRKMNDAHIRNAKRLKKMILELRGLYIKVGQLISIMSNFLPEKFRDELEALQDKIPPRPYEEIALRIRTELGNSPEKLFKSFNKEPIASASLAQVHEAYLPDGSKVAVKVQYMDIEKLAKIDLRTLQRILKITEFFFHVKGISTNFLQIREMILDELNFQKEAEHIETISSNFKGNPEVKFPHVVHQLSTNRILTTEFMDGIKVTNLAFLEESNIERGALADRIVKAYCQMIFVDGIYHADPHPGNLLVQKDGSVVFLDFGAVARLSPEMKEGIPQFLEGVIKRDKVKITDSLKLMGFIAINRDGYDVETLIDFIYSRFLQEMSFESWSLKNLQGSIENPMEMVGDFRKLDISLRDLMALFQIPKDWVLLERTIMLLMGLCTHLQEDMNPMKTIKPYLENFVFGKGKNWKKFVGNIIKDTMMSVVKLPGEMNKLISKANKGELNFRIKDIPESADLIYALGHQFLYGLFCMACGSLAYFSHLNNESQHEKWFLGISIFFALCILRSMWKVKRKRAKRR